MKKINIGLLRETKTPTDNRVVLTPEQVIGLIRKYPALSFRVQPSKDRIFPDRAYERLGIPVEEDLSGCDYLFGVKEADVDTLMPHKHYFFFGHIAKQQVYNLPLREAMMEKRITFTDYEYLKRRGKRVCAFGWEAGVVGVYNTIRMYGLKYGKFFLPPFIIGTVSQIRENLSSIREAFHACHPKILVTGNGRVAKGAMDALSFIGVPHVRLKDFLENEEKLCYGVARHKDLLKDSRGKYDRSEAYEHPERYFSVFDDYARMTDILIACHFWDGRSAKYLKREMVNSGNRIRVVGDVTCDINGSIETTIRPSTHVEPFYDVTSDLKEARLFADKENISVMAVDNCPNAIPEEASIHFGQQLIDARVFHSIANERNSKMITDATIIRNGEITEPFSFLS